MIRERLYLSQILIGACEKQTQFKVAAWDTTVPEDCDDEFFKQRAPMFQIKERSECCQRYCCHQFRALQLGVFPLEVDADGNIRSQGDLEGGRSGWPEGIDPVLVLEVRARVLFTYAKCLTRFMSLVSAVCAQWWLFFASALICCANNRNPFDAPLFSAAGCPSHLKCWSGALGKRRTITVALSSIGNGGTAFGLATNTCPCATARMP